MNFISVPRPNPPKNYVSNTSINKIGIDQPRYSDDDDIHRYNEETYHSNYSYHQDDIITEKSTTTQKNYLLHQTYEPSNPLSSHMDPPFVVDQLKSVVVEEGKTAQFRVRVWGRPQPKVVWSKDDCPIDFQDSPINFSSGSGSRFKRETTGDVYKLIITNAAFKDRGIYAISAENEFGRALNSADLDVVAPVPLNAASK